MKLLLSLTIGILFSTSVFAYCGANYLSIFPSGNTIKQNSIFVLDGYAQSQKVILGLNKKHAIYLKSGNEKIKLIVIETCVGQYQLTQAILKPEKELIAGNEYTLFIDSLPEFERLNKYNTKTKKYEAINYKVISEKDEEKPFVSEKPKELNKSLIRFGCVPSIHV